MKSVCVYLFPLLVLTCYSQERSNVGEYNILDYGSKKDSSFLSSEAINQAITDCSANGGGRVVIPAGKYKSGTILMKDYVELYFEPGSYLYAYRSERYLSSASTGVSFRKRIRWVYVSILIQIKKMY